MLRDPVVWVAVLAPFSIIIAGALWLAGQIEEAWGETGLTFVWALVLLGCIVVMTLIFVGFLFIKTRRA